MTTNTFNNTQRNAWLNHLFLVSRSCTGHDLEALRRLLSPESFDLNWFSIDLQERIQRISTAVLNNSNHLSSIPNEVRELCEAVEENESDFERVASPYTTLFRGDSMSPEHWTFKSISKEQNDSSDEENGLKPLNYFSTNAK